MDAITAYQLTSMMQGVVQRGSGTGVNLPVPVAGKTGTTNDAKDVWFIGYTSNIVAGCYMGFDQPRSLGPGAFGGTLCVPVFQEFMKEVVKHCGGTEFKVPPGGYFKKIDRFTGALPGGRMPRARTWWPNTSAKAKSRCLALGEVIDGGFAMGSNLPLFAYGESDSGRQRYADHVGRADQIGAEEGQFRHAVIGRAVLAGRLRSGPISRRQTLRGSVFRFVAHKASTRR